MPENEQPTGVPDAMSRSSRVCLTWRCSAQIGKLGVVLVVEPLARKTGLGVRFGTWLLERGLTPKYGYIGVTREGSGGLWEQVYHQVPARHPAIIFFPRSAWNVQRGAGRALGGPGQVAFCAVNSSGRLWRAR